MLQLSFEGREGVRQERGGYRHRPELTSHLIFEYSVAAPLHLMFLLLGQIDPAELPILQGKRPSQRGLLDYPGRRHLSLSLLDHAISLIRSVLLVYGISTWALGSKPNLAS